MIKNSIELLSRYFTKFGKNFAWFRFLILPFEIFDFNNL